MSRVEELINGSINGYTSVSAPKVASEVLDTLADEDSNIIDGETFVESELGRLAYEGLSAKTRKSLKHSATPLSGAGKQKVLFEGLDDFVAVPQPRGPAEFMKTENLMLAEWQAARRYKQEKAEETLEAANKMLRFESEHLEFWEQNPGLTAKEVRDRADN